MSAMRESKHEGDGLTQDTRQRKAHIDQYWWLFKDSGDVWYMGSVWTVSGIYENYKVGLRQKNNTITADPRLVTRIPEGAQKKTKR